MSNLNPTLTVTQAARAGHCSTTTIHRLVNAKTKDGKPDPKIKAVQAYKGARYAITSTREEIAAAVAALPRKTGYHHRTKRYSNNGAEPKRKAGTSKITGRLAELAVFLALPENVRAALFVLADQCSLDDLQTLIELTEKLADAK